jgi:hypothetical protein
MSYIHPHTLALQTMCVAIQNALQALSTQQAQEFGKAVIDSLRSAAESLDMMTNLCREGALIEHLQEFEHVLDPDLEQSLRQEEDQVWLSKMLGSAQQNIDRVTRKFEQILK